MSNTITAFFKGRVGVAEAVYQNDYGLVMNLDDLDLPAHFDCYFSTLEQDEAIPGIGADNQVVIPNDCLSRAGNVTLHIPLHTGANDSEVEYIVYFKVIGRARPVDDGTPVQMTAIEQALALLQNPIGNIEQIVNEALAFTGDTFDEMQDKLDADQAAYETEMGERADAFEAGITSRQTQVESRQTQLESSFDNLNAQYQTAVAAHTVDSEVQNIRVGADNVTYTSAGEAVRKQFTDLKSDLNSVEIDLFTKGTANNWQDVKGSATKTTGYFIHGSDAEPTASAQWNYYTINVKAGEEYLFRSLSNSWARCAVLVDGNGDVISAYPSENVSNKVLTFVITIPSNGATLYVNENTSTAFIDFASIEKNENEYFYEESGDFKNKVLSLVGDSVSISDYSNTSTVSYQNIKSTGKKVEGYFFNAYDATPAESSSWNYYWFNVKEGDRVKVKSYSAGWARVIAFTDLDFNIIETYPSAASTGIQTYEVVVPSGAKKMFVNENSAQHVAEIYKGVVDQVHFIKGSAPIAEKVSGTEYTIGTDEYVYGVDLEDSYSKTFCLNTLKKGGSTFKDVSDDITPLNLNTVRYIGAGHGFLFGYNLTINSHGLTTANIGATYNDGTNTWVLIKIINTNVIQVVCYDASVWYKMKSADAPDVVNFGTGNLAVSTSSLTQIYPSAKNIDVEIVENANVCKILETYDIINIGTGIEAIKNNVGSNTNDSLVSLSDGAIAVRNFYEFSNNGAMTIYQNIKPLISGINLNFYGAVQSGAFGASDYYGVAGTSLKYQAVGTTAYFERDVWDDQTVPPMLYMQTDGSAGNKAFFMGYIAENRNADIYVGGSAGFIYGNTKKMYPYFINPNAVINRGKVYNCVSFRIPCTLHDASDDVAYFGYTPYYGGYIVVIGTDEATEASISVPSFMQGSKCSVVMNDGIVCQTKVVVDSIDIQSTGRGYAVLKIDL